MRAFDRWLGAGVVLLVAALAAGCGKPPSPSPRAVEMVPDRGSSPTADPSGGMKTYPKDGPVPPPVPAGQRRDASHQPRMETKRDAQSQAK